MIGLRGQLEQIVVLVGEIERLAAELDTPANCHVSALSRYARQMRGAIKVLTPKERSWACQIAGCQKQSKATAAYCWTHYQRVSRYGDPNFVSPMPVRPPCSVSWCEKLADARGLCQMHRARQRLGQPLEPRSLRRVAHPCSIDWCERVGGSGGLCGMHRHRQERGLPMDAREIPGPGSRPGIVRRCTVVDCAKPVYALQLCHAHYEAQRTARRKQASS